MKQELEQKFYQRWPQWFNQSFLVFDFECGDGWFDLLWKLCEDIEKLNPNEDFKIVQIKEKFGTLRCYIDGSTDAIFDRISKAEEDSYKICEKCGSTENVSTKGPGWIVTLCKECREKNNSELFYFCGVK